MSATLSRRAALTGIALAGGAALLPIAAASMVRAETVATDPTFTAKLAAYRKAKAAEDAFYTNVANPAEAAFFDASRAWEAACEAIPHTTTATAYERHDGDVRPMSTDNPMAIIVARALLREDEKWQSPDCLKTCRELVAAVESREAKKIELRAVYKLDALEARSDELMGQSADNNDRTWAHLAAVMRHPVHSLPEVVAKLDLIEEVQPDDEFIPDIIADVRRLAAQGRA